MWAWAWLGWRVVHRSGESGQHGQLRSLIRSNEQLSIVRGHAVFWKDAVCTTNAAALRGSHYYYLHFPVGNNVWKRFKKIYFCIHYMNIIITLMAIKKKEKINSWSTIQTNQTVLIFSYSQLVLVFLPREEKYVINIIWVNFCQCFKQCLAHYVLAVTFSSIQTKNL